MSHNLKFCVRWKSSVSVVLSSLLLSVDVFVPMSFAPASAQAQPASVQAKRLPLAPPLQVTSTSQLRNATVMLKSIERLFDKVERQKVVTLEDSEAVSKSTFGYAQAMKSVLDDALESAEIAARTQGKQGSIVPLDTFEKAEKANESRLQKIDIRATSIENRIERGTILIDKPSIEKLSIMERGEFLNSLQPPARTIYIQTQPDLFKPVLEAPQGKIKSLDKTSESQQSFLPNARNVFGYADRYSGTPLSNTLQGINEIIVPPAYAAVALGCIGLVLSGNWGPAVDCIVNAGSASTQIYNSFVGCYNSARPPLRGLKRASCLARFIIRLG